MSSDELSTYYYTRCTSRCLSYRITLNEILGRPKSNDCIIEAKIFTSTTLPGQPGDLKISYDRTIEQCQTPASTCARCTHIKEESARSVNHLPQRVSDVTGGNSVAEQRLKLNESKPLCACRVQPFGWTWHIAFLVDKQMQPAGNGTS